MGMTIVSRRYAFMFADGRFVAPMRGLLVLVPPGTSVRIHVDTSRGTAVVPAGSLAEAQGYLSAIFGDPFLGLPSRVIPKDTRQEPYDGPLADQYSVHTAK